MGVNKLPIQRREISIFNTQTIDKIASSITAYDNALDKYKVFNKLTDNGTVEGIFMEDGELYVNGTWVATGVLSDAQGKNAWNLDTGDLAMTKGSISLGALSGGGYNFTVTDAGALTMKSGSITLGDMSDTTDSSKYYFNVDTNGKLSWNSNYSSMSNTGVFNMTKGSINLGAQTGGGYNFSVTDAGAVTIKSGSISLGSSSGTYYFNADTTGAMQWKSANSSMSSTGVLSTTGADIKGTITTVNGDYKTVLQDGFVYFYANNALIGKIGAAAWTNTDTQTDYYGFDLDIPANAQTGGFYLGTGTSASELWVYHRADSKWHSSKAIEIDIGDYYGVLSANAYGLTADGANIATQTWVTGQNYLQSADPTDIVIEGTGVGSGSSIKIDNTTGDYGIIIDSDITVDLNAYAGVTLTSGNNSLGVGSTGAFYNGKEIATKNWVNSQTYATQQYVSDYYQDVYDDWYEATTYKSFSEFNRGSSNQFTGIDLRTLSWFHTVSDTDSRVITLSPKTYSGTCYLPCDTSFSTWITLKFYHGIAIVA